LRQKGVLAEEFGTVSRTPVHRFALAPIAVQSVQLPPLFGIANGTLRRRPHAGHC